MVETKTQVVIIDQSRHSLVLLIELAKRGAKLCEAERKISHFA